MMAKQNIARMKRLGPKTPNIWCDQFAILLFRVNEIDEDTLESHHRQPGAWTPDRPEPKEFSMKKSTQVKNFLAILFLLMNFSSTYAEEDHDHHEGIHPQHKAMHKNRGYTQIVIGGLAYADCSHRIGVCELLYHEGHANQEAKRWGFFLPKLPVKLVEFNNEILIGINNKCYYIDPLEERPLGQGRREG